MASPFQNLHASEKEGLALLALIVIMAGIVLAFISQNHTVALVGGEAFSRSPSSAVCPQLKENSCPVQGVGFAATIETAQKLALQNCNASLSRCAVVEDHEHTYNASHCPSTSCSFGDARLVQSACVITKCVPAIETSTTPTKGAKGIQCLAIGQHDYSGYSCQPL